MLGRVHVGSMKSYDKLVISGQPIYGTDQKIINPTGPFINMPTRSQLMEPV